MDFGAGEEELEDSGFDSIGSDDEISASSESQALDASQDTGSMSDEELEDSSSGEGDDVDYGIDLAEDSYGDVDGLEREREGYTELHTAAGQEAWGGGTGCTCPSSCLGPQQQQQQQAQQQCMCLLVP
jgi:hypothetical protein